MQVPHEARTKATHPHECVVCGRLFRDFFSLCQHEKVQHNIRHRVPRRGDEHLTEADYQTWLQL